MRLKLTVGGPAGDTDVQVTADSAATVADVADALGSALELEGSDATLRVHGVPSSDSAAILLDPQAPLGESGLSSGVRVGIAPAAELFDAAGHRRGAAQATLRVVEGPDAGAQFPLPAGVSHVGRDETADIRLTDPFVSKRHIRISVSSVIEVSDLGSANGTTIAGDQVQRALVRSGDHVKIGDSVIALELLTPARPTSDGAVEFNRPPIVLRAFEGAELDMPEPPDPPRPHRFPILALVAPVVLMCGMLGVSYIARLKLSPLMFVMAGLSPLLMVGNFIDQRRQSRNEARSNAAHFAASVGALREELAAFQESERTSRLREAPSTADGYAAAFKRAPLLWSRRPDLPGFLDVRLGLGSVVSRMSVKLPDRRRTRPDDWSTLRAVAEDFRLIHDTPVVGALRDAGGLGVAGPTDLMASAARAFLAQLAVLHSPAELSIVAIGSTLSSSGWDWLKWLPHVGSAHSPVKDVSLANSVAGALRLVSQLEDLLADRGESDAGNGVAVLLVVMDDAPIDRARLVTLAERGPSVGIHILWCAENYAQIPAACRSFVVLDANGVGQSGQVHLGETVTPVSCEVLDLPTAQHLARTLAPLEDAGARVEDDSDLPRSVSFLSTLGTGLARNTDDVRERWVANDPSLTGGERRDEPVSLRAIVGQSARETFALDLRVHGPHALVGGTTGAGKSEFLQTWVLSLAASQSPRRVNFLFVDYKGGSAFARCTDLPHSVGIVTDLDKHLVRRALTSLRAELVYREEKLAEHRAKDIIDLEKKSDAEPLPSLIIVVDEFAALAQEIPEFVDGLVDVAQRGRSLGLHLILATQRPSGVIKGNLRANTNLRVALRMADADDSTDVIGDASAAAFDPGIPGRAVAKTGPGRITAFQSLYVGGATPDVAPRPSIDIETLAFGAGERLRAHKAKAGSGESGERPATDLDRTVDQIIAASRSLELPEARRPWLPVLAPVWEWALIPQRTDAELVLGIRDLPHRQATDVVHFLPDEHGNFAVIGTGGSGKSTVLRTLAASAGGTLRGGPCDVYGLDFGSRGLAMIEELPHVGSVIVGSDHERVGRLLRWLRDEVDDRSRRYAAAKAANISEFRERANAPDERRILVLIDGFGAFRQEYEVGPRNGYFTLLGQLAADGRAVGIHFVFTADRPAVIPASLGATIQQRLVLRLADANDYPMVGEPADVLGPESPPGRGLMGGLEVQVAVLGGSASLPAQADKTAKYGRTLRERGRTATRSIERLAERISLSDIDTGSTPGLVIGVGDDDLAPFAIRPAGTFLVVGPPGSGRTTALATLSVAARKRGPVFLFGSRRTRLRNIVEWDAAAFDDDSATRLAADLTELVNAGKLGQSATIVIEAIESLVGSSAEAGIDALVKLAADHEVLVVGELEIGAITSSYLLGNTFRGARRGIALQPDDVDGQTVFKVLFPRAARSEFPQGRGMVVDGGRARRVQIALPE